MSKHRLSVTPELSSLAQRYITRIGGLVLFLVHTSGVFAGQEVARIPITDAPPMTPAIGGGIRTGNDIYIGGGREPDFVPLYLYEGKYIFAHGTSAGVHVFRNDIFSFDALLRYRFQQLDPEDNELLSGMNKRRQTVDAGLSASMRGRFGEMKAEWVTDAQNRHNGNEFELTYRYPFSWGNFSLSPFVGMTWQDEDLTAYYFGVSEEEAQPDLPAYAPGSARNFGYGVNMSYHLTDHIFMFANLGFQTLDSKIQDSPIVEEDLSSAAFFGAGYFFGDMNRSASSDTQSDTVWSWRLNYGYTGNHNIVPEPMQGNLTRSDKADTNIAGLTLGRLFQSGPRVDFYGKFALYRHLENGLQDDFWNYTAYMMAIGKGYFPWSERVAFRWGFGFGVSLAEKVPAIEQIKQDERDRNTSHFLNYLEFTADFPIDGIIKAKFARNCYVGLTVVHRSGIFSTSDILGDVFGGADWYTAHLECLR
jgi:outer membrane protein